MQLSFAKPDAALAAYNDALRIRREIGAKKDSGDTLIDIGNLYLERGQPDLALQNFKESLQIQRDAGDEAYQALCLNNIANAYAEKGENEDALTYLQQALQIREKLNASADIADTLRNLGVTYTALGQYDSAMTSLMRGLELFRKGGDILGAAKMSHSMALVFEYEGRPGAAVGVLQDAVKAYRDAGDRSSNLAQALGDLAGALGAVGRGSEAPNLIEEALGLARVLKNDALVAGILNNQGDAYFYQGDLKAARSSYEQASRLTSHAADKDLLLTCRLNLGRVTVAEGRSRSALRELRDLSQKADSEGQKYVAVASSGLLATILIDSKDFSGARKELQRSLGKSEKLGLRLESARIHYLLGRLSRFTGSSSDAAPHFAEASRMFQEIAKESGAEHLADRYDLKPIYYELKNSN